ncbi:hypothetical protein E2C01_002441 [Portunus trituberculatus]|uniref:Uncharacterized protein n=1 Tax=Portunus trituberculatus TaxID=210409 RepID=A0A5B7CQQ8_PORTR|nr:hypothetical protein [Portunus trituberculatus]
MTPLPNHCLVYEGRRPLFGGCCLRVVTAGGGVGEVENGRPWLDIMIVVVVVVVVVVSRLAPLSHAPHPHSRSHAPVMRKLQPAHRHEAVVT